MPELRPETQAERVQHLLTNTRPRRNGDVINQPDDALEGGGDMVTRDRNGNPLMLDGSVAFQFGNLESPDGWYPYLSQGEGQPTKQASAPLPITRESFLGNQPIFLGDPPPAILVQAKIPRPEAPILVAEAVGVEGYATSTESSPYFLLHTYAVGPEGQRRHSLPSPATVVPPVQNGQSIKDILPTQIPKGITHVGVWQTEPGTSTSVSPGTFWLQREVEVEHYNPGYYDLTGPFRAGTASRKLPTRNETQLPAPSGAVQLVHRSNSLGSKPGQYLSRIVWTDVNGLSLPGGFSNPVTLVATLYAYDADFSQEDQPDPIAARGDLQVTQPSNPPPGATGWLPFLYTDGQWNVIYDAFNEYGNERPYPLSRTTAHTQGWSSSGDNDYSRLADSFLVQRDLPTENTTGFEEPTDPPGQPVVFGTVRPPAGPITALITETLRGKESPPSPTASITITSSQVPRLIRQDWVNLIPNGEFTEISAAGLPLGHTVVTTNGTAIMEGADLVLKTTAATSSTTPSNTTMPVAVNRNKDWRVEALIAAENPATGSFQGNAEVVLEELDASGAVTQTVLGTLSSAGQLKVDKIIYAYGTTGLPGGSVVWKVGTLQARVLVRYSGTTKNLNVRISYTILYDKKHKPPRRKRGPWEIGDFDVPDSTQPEPDPSPQDDPGTLPPGDESGAIPPPEDPLPPEPIPAVGPALVAAAAPDRPFATGTVLESKHTFESAFPSGWDQIVSGATLTRDATSQLSGTYSLRSYKAAP